MRDRQGPRGASRKRQIEAAHAGRSPPQVGSAARGRAARDRRGSPRRACAASARRGSARGACRAAASARSAAIAPQLDARLAQARRTWASLCLSSWSRCRARLVQDLALAAARRPPALLQRLRALAPRGDQQLALLGEELAASSRSRRACSGLSRIALLARVERAEQRLPGDAAEDTAQAEKVSTVQKNVPSCGVISALPRPPLALGAMAGARRPSAASDGSRAELPCDGG